MNKSCIKYFVSFADNAESLFISQLALSKVIYVLVYLSSCLIISSIIFAFIIINS